MAAPIASQVLGEVLPYLEITKDNQEEEEKQEVVVPNLIGKTIDEAKKGLEELKLNIEVREESENETEEITIIEQLPKAGVKIKEGTSVIVYK